MIELPTIPGYGNGVGSFGSSRYLPSLDLAFAEDKAFTVNTASPGNASITSRRGPSANFLRQSGATYINAQGLIEYAPENLVTQSENPSNVNWYKADAVAVTLTTDPTPTGSLNAYRVDATYSGNGIIASIGGVPTGSSLVTGSIWLKASSPIPLNTFISLRSDIGSLILEQGITITSEWQRFSITGNTGGNSVIRVGVGGNNTFDYGKSFYIWGAQIERHSSARTYLPTTTSPFYGPRFDHDPITKICKGLFIEESRSNLLLRSEEFNDGVWVKGNGGGPILPSVSSNQIISPSGILNADRASFPAVTGSGAYSLIYQSFTQTAGIIHTASVYLRGINGGEKVWLMWTPNGINYTRTECVLTTTWQRFSITYTAATGVNYIQIGVDLRDTSQTAQLAQVVYAWGAQLEVGSTPSSYIPTTNGTVLRSADISSISNTSSFWNSSQFTLFTHANFATPNIDAYSANFHPQLFGHRRASSNYVVAIIRENVNNDLTLNALTTGVAKIISTHTTGQQAACMNGGTVVSATSNYIPPLNPPLYIGYSGFGGVINGHIARVTYYRRRLPNRILQLFTTL